MPGKKKSDVQFILPDPAPEADALVVGHDEYLETPYTSILMSTASGPGLLTAMAKTPASFVIAAHDQNGDRRPVGGDPFSVSVRGAAPVFAKVTDNGDGTYGVDYKPSTSGTYTIAITLHGVPMPGSPFALTVLAPRADAARCAVHGGALSSITARHQSSFEIEFIDAFGQIAHAEELDVFVEPRPQPVLPEGAPPLPTEELLWAVVAPNLPKPLIVRAEAELESGRVGEVGPGTMVGVLKTQDLPDGSRRALVMFRPNASRIGGSALVRSPPRSPDRSRGASPTTTRSNTPCHTPGRTPMSTPGRSRPSTPGRPGSPGRSLSARAHSPGRSPRKSPGNSPRSPRMSSLFANPLDGVNGRGGTPRVPSFARPIGEPSDRATRSRSPPSIGAAAAAAAAAETGMVGWVTALKDGKETLVLRHLKLDANRRQGQMRLWQKQLAAEANRKAAEQRTSNRNAEDRQAARAGPSCAHELEADKRGVAFAYGGVDPGTLHAHGKLIKMHQVHYSVGRAGEYLLHVGIRNQTAALPGSPFELSVKPGPAHPVATSLITDEFGRAVPLLGVVGDAGSVVIQTSDRMGNRCIKGQAPLKVETKSKELTTQHVDNDDGTYQLQWLGEVSGKYEVYVTIDGVNVTGSPCELALHSAKPEVSKCEISGGGLSHAVAGEKVEVIVRCKDRFSNPTTPGTAMSFGLAVAPPGGDHHTTTTKDKGKGDKNKDDAEKKEKKVKDSSADDAASSLPSQDFEGKWLAEGEYEIKYVAEKAGDFELHLWCDVEGDGQRQKVPGSPFQLNVVAAKASANGSLITGADQVREQPLTAGEPLELALFFRDDFGNPCVPPARSANKQQAAKDAEAEEAANSASSRGPRRGSMISDSAATAKSARGPLKSGGAGALSRGAPGEANKAGDSKRDEGMLAKLMTPHDEEIITDRLRPGDGVGTFTLRHDLQLAGKYEAHFLLNGQHLTGSPVDFRVKPAAPSGRLSTLHPPDDVPPVTGIVYELTLVAEDKFSNRLDRGGASVQARALGPSASPATHVDHGDGTYGVRFTAGSAGEYRVEVRLDNIKIKGSPLLINFTEPTAAQKRQLAERAASAPAAMHEEEQVSDAAFDVTDDAGSRVRSPTPDRDASPPGSSRNSARSSDPFGSARRPSAL